MDENDGGASIPQEPMTTLLEAAAGLHELFGSFVEAGFTTQQALYLCGQVIRGQAAQLGDSSE